MRLQQFGERVLAASFSLGLLLASSGARADLRSCMLTGGGIACTAGASCNNDAQCFATGDSRCVTAGSGGSACVPDCNALFPCTSDPDCPEFDGVSGTCRAVTLTGATGLCEYTDTMGRARVRICAAGPNPTLVEIRNCFVGGSWANGDCDGDGIPNDVDTDPCSPDVRTLLSAVPSPFCLPGHICQGTSDVCTPFLRCDDTSDCTAAATRVGGTSWECGTVPTVSIAFCQPICDATAHCTTTADCGMLGACRVAGGALSMCVPAALAACADGCESNPLDWATSQGDCDGDGAENGCDPMPCAVTTTTTCAFDHRCAPPDAGVAIDASTNVPDATISTNDAAQGQDAASVDDASAPDSGSSVPDAQTTMDASTIRDASAFDGGVISASPGIGFGGGGGCRCGIASRHGDASRVGWLVLALAFLTRRARR